MNQSFPKEERLKNLKIIQTVISKGKVIRFGYIKIHWMFIPSENEKTETKTYLLKAGFSVPKKKIKRAYGRNQIRRKMKEIFRLHKELFYEYIPYGKQLVLFIIYKNNEKTDYKTLEDNLVMAFNRINENINKINKTNSK